MHYLGLALFAEGSTDHRFLRPLLYRLCDELCLGSLTAVEVSEVLELHTPAGLKDRPRAELPHPLFHSSHTHSSSKSKFGENRFTTSSNSG